MSHTPAGLASILDAVANKTTIPTTAWPVVDTDPHALLVTALNYPTRNPAGDLNAVIATVKQIAKNCAPVWHVAGGRDKLQVVGVAVIANPKSEDSVQSAVDLFEYLVDREMGKREKFGPTDTVQVIVNPAAWQIDLMRSAERAARDLTARLTRVIGHQLHQCGDFPYGPCVCAETGNLLPNDGGSWKGEIASLAGQLQDPPAEGRGMAVHIGRGGQRTEHPIMPCDLRIARSSRCVDGAR